jgi:predicted Zn-dependent peptidase
VGRRAGLSALLALELAALFLGVLALPTAAGAAEMPVVRDRLDNGFTVLVRPNPAAPVVAVSLQIKMGTRWETAANVGISNYVQAAIVKGTTKHNGGEIAEIITGLGGTFSANGDTDYSEIKGTALARFWRELLGLTAELALEPAFQPEQVEGEKEFLVARIQKRADNPATRAFDTFFAKLYAGHPYGLPTLGTRESIARLDTAAIVAWYRRFYRPERMVLAVSGQVPAAEVVAEARRLFGGMRATGKAPPDAAPPTPVAKGGRTVLEQAAQQTQIVTGRLAPRVSDRDYAAVQVLRTVLGGGLAGRLFVELRDTQALAYTVSAFVDPAREPGSLLIYMGTAPENGRRAEPALMRELERIRTERIRDEELRRAKAYLLGTFAMDRRTNARQAWYLAFYETVGVGWDFPDRYRTAVEAVTAADVLRVARTYLTPLTTVVLQPPRKP